MASPKHKTHVSGQAAFNRHTLTQPDGGHRPAASQRVWLDYEALCRYFPDEVLRAEALGISRANVADWQQGRNGRSVTTTNPLSNSTARTLAAGLHTL